MRMSQGLPLGIIYLLEIPQKNAGVTSANYTLIMNMKKVGIVVFLSRHLGNYGILFYKPVYDWFIVYFTCTVIKLRLMRSFYLSYLKQKSSGSLNVGFDQGIY